MANRRRRNQYKRSMAQTLEIACSLLERCASEEITSSQRDALVKELGSRLADIHIRSTYLIENQLCGEFGALISRINTLCGYLLKEPEEREKYIKVVQVEQVVSETWDQVMKDDPWFGNIRFLPGRHD
jgi:hypothetical protein